jgi:hypothetical protein
LLLLDAFAASSHHSIPRWHLFSTSELEVLLLFGKVLDARVTPRLLGVIASQHATLVSV